MVQDKFIDGYVDQLKNEVNGRYNGSEVELNIYKARSFGTIYVDYLIEGTVICRTNIVMVGRKYDTSYVGINDPYYWVNIGYFDTVLDARLLADIGYTYDLVVGYKEGCNRLGSLLGDLGIRIGKEMGNTNTYWAVIPNYDGASIYVRINGEYQTIHKTWDDLESGNLRECLLTIKGLMSNLINYKDRYKQLRDGLYIHHGDIQDNLFDELELE